MTAPVEIDVPGFGRVPVVERACPACGNDASGGRSERTDTPPEWPLIRCGGCGFVFLSRGPDYSALFTNMSWERTTRVEEQRRAEARPYSYRFSKFTRWRMRLLPRTRPVDQIIRHARPGNVLDLGCGDGGQLDGLPDHFVPHGIEISTDIARRAQEKFSARGGEAVNDSVLSGLSRFPEGFFSAAVARSYLEHELQPRAVLDALLPRLAVGGVALVKVPNYGSINRRVMGARWCGFRFPDHLNYFTPAGLRDLAESCGFHVKFGFTGRLPTSDNMHAVLRRPG
ncbi:MAG: class I SAM-dependent methyltransferase [Alphaproteobacteria bacterium]